MAAIIRIALAANPIAKNNRYGFSIVLAAGESGFERPGIRISGKVC
jgi:hypothetical protein